MRTSNGQISDAKHYAEKRREAALKQQKSARSRQLKAARQTDEVLSSPLDYSQQGQSIQEKEITGKTSIDQWFQLQLPEWMIDCPSSLSEDWLVMPRPEGKRCLLETSSRGQTVTRGRNGYVVHNLKSSLPASCCIDCIFHEPNKTFYALDLIAWNGHEFLSCDASFRLSWLQSKMEEETTTASREQSKTLSTDNEEIMSSGHETRTALILTDPATSNTFHLIPLPFFPSDIQGLTSCYQQSIITPSDSTETQQICTFGFIPDGLSFIHKESHYFPGQSPLFVLWKDAQCSRYLLDTDSKGQPLDRQQLTLQLLMDGTVATSDEPPVVLGQLPANFPDKISPGLRAGRLLRFALGPGGIQFHDSRPCGADLTYLGLVNQRRSKADCFTKILFQHQARRNPLSFNHLINSCNNSDRNENECTMDEDLA